MSTELPVSENTCSRSASPGNSPLPHAPGQAMMYIQYSQYVCTSKFVPFLTPGRHSIRANATTMSVYALVFALPPTLSA